MKIIKMGQMPEDKYYETTCNDCKTEFEFYESEGRWVCGSQESSILSINCPLCQKDIGLEIPREAYNEKANTATAR